MILSPNSVTWTRFTDHTETPKQDINGSVIDTFYLPIRFTPDWNNYVILEWDTPEEWADKEPLFSIFRGESEGGDFVAVSGEPFDANRFKAYESVKTAKFESEFWIVQATLNDGSIYKTHPVSMTQQLPRWQWLRYSEMVRREKILLRKFTGVDILIFKRRNYGHRCPDCWDPKLEKIMKEGCTTCYGTSFFEGYHPGIKSKAQFEGSTKSRRYTYFGKFEPNQLVAWTVNYPSISPYDIVIRLSDFRVYRVEALQNTEMMTTTLRQIMQLTELPRTSIEYQLLHNGASEEVPYEPHVHS